jgi:hypothetical protein
MALEGMDVQAMGPVLSTLSNAVGELETLIGSTNGVYSTIEQGWVGSDANLSQLHQHLQLNYSAQEQASNTY